VRRLVLATFGDSKLLEFTRQPDDGVSNFLRNVGKLLADYTALHFGLVCCRYSGLSVP
jgi:hypothetical protein